MTFYATTCRMCRDFRGDLECAWKAFVVLSILLAVFGGIGGSVVFVVWMCVEQNMVWPIISIGVLFVYWLIYKEMC